MDGRTTQPSVLAKNAISSICTALCILLLLCTARLSYGEAMGKVTLDTTDSDPVAKPELKPESKPEIKPDPPKGPDAAIPAVPEIALPQVFTLPSEAAASRPVEPPLAANSIEKRPIKAPSTTEDPQKNSPQTASAASALPAGLGGALQVATALTVVIGLIFIGKALAKKFLPGAKAGNGKGVIEVLARYPLAKNQSVVLLRIGSQIVALNQTKERSESVLVISDPMEVAKIMGQIEGESPKSSHAGFTKLLANARMDLSDEANHPEQAMESEGLDEQLEEMAAAKRQLMELRHQVRSVRDRMSS